MSGAVTRTGSGLPAAAAVPRKRWLARALALLLRLPEAEPRPPSTSELRRILLIRIDERVGNVLLTTPLVKALRLHFPAAELEVLVSSSKEALISTLAPTIAFRKKDLFRRPWRFLATMWRLRSRRYDLAIDASHWDVFSLSSALLLGLTRARFRVAHDRGEARRFATHLAPPPAEREHDARTKLRLLEAIGIQSADTQTELGLVERPRPPELGRFLDAERAHGQPLVGLVAGARKLDRRAPSSFFVALGRSLLARGLRPVLIYGPGEEELAASLGEALGLPLPPSTDLPSLVTLLAALDAVASNDTGPMHLAVAAGVPTLSLFLHPDLERWGYREPPHAALSLVALGEEEALRLAVEMLEREARARAGRIDF